MAFSQHTLKYSKQLEETLGCGTVQDKKSCLKTKNLTEILLAGKFPWMVVPDDLDLVFYSPRFDGEILVGNNFREAIVKAPKIDSLIGINSNEAIAFAVNALNRYSMNATYAPVQKDKQATFNQTNLEAAFKFLLSQNNAFQPNPETPIQEIIDFYLQQKPKFPNYPDLNAFVQLFSDVGYNVPVVREAKFKASHGRKIYVYMNDYEIPNNPIKSQYLVGNSHCAENTMIFGNTSGFEPPIVGKYKQVMENFVQMWISFIKFGIPRFGNMTLEKATPNRVPFAHILNDTRLENDLWADRSSFWDHIARTYGFDWIFGRPTSWNL
uniref:Carboxylesterase type B domain-containing protein n=2 Tax=Panagrolaimus sp. JU765 TaxID=591449 RepID=A0AC34RL56_9BILA